VKEKRIRFTWNLNSVYQAVKKKNMFSSKIIQGSGSGILKFKISGAQFFPT
jgi:phage-related protein